MPSMTILLHEADGYPDRRGYLIWVLADRWRRAGLEVRVAKGVTGTSAADLIFPHIDRTVVAQPYRDFLERHPQVVNRGFYDISKRAVSSLLVGPGDAYDGPVIVKTNLNHGGLNETPPRSGMLGALGRRARRARTQDWSTLRVMIPREYPVFDSLADVPRAVFDNPALVVERFLPQRDGDLYVLQMHHFLGDCHMTNCLSSRSPVVKARRSEANERIADHDEVVALRHRLGLEYGKLDYVIHEGRPVLLDVNLTPGLPRSPALATERADMLAPGIHGLLAKPRCLG